jgi:hypothetical protein
MAPREIAREMSSARVRSRARDRVDRRGDRASVADPTALELLRFHNNAGFYALSGRKPAIVPLASRKTEAV